MTLTYSDKETPEILEYTLFNNGTLKIKDYSADNPDICKDKEFTVDLIEVQRIYQRIKEILDSDFYDNDVIQAETKATNIQFRIMHSMYGHIEACSPFLEDSEAISIIALMDGLIAYAQKKHTYYNWCQVSFNEFDDHGYSYFCDDDTVKPGDTVIVPVGKDNVEKEARVISFLRLSKENLPFPADKTKKVIRVSSRADAESDKKG